jgi:hypothetical protein
LSVCQENQQYLPEQQELEEKEPSEKLSFFRFGFVDGSFTFGYIRKKDRQAVG